jgi:hypothetical protein
MPASDSRKKKGIPGRSHRLTAVKESEYVLFFMLLFLRRRNSR